MYKLLSLTAVLVVLSMASTVGTTSAKAQVKDGITKHDRQVIRFFKNHPKLAATPEGGRILARILPHVVRSLQAKQTAEAWPTHHALWGCINEHESYHNWAGVNSNGHYGGLQMHPDWGHGTSHHASDDSQLVQERAAEDAYAGTGYSTSFLYGQWFDYETGGAADCLRYA